MFLEDRCRLALIAHHEPETALRTTVLLARPDYRRRGARTGLVPIPDAEVRRLNRYVVENAHREVYASVKSVGFTMLVNKRMKKKPFVLPASVRGAEELLTHDSGAGHSLHLQHRLGFQLAGAAGDQLASGRGGQPRGLYREHRDSRAGAARRRAAGAPPPPLAARARRARPAPRPSATLRPRAARAAAFRRGVGALAERQALPDAGAPRPPLPGRERRNHPVLPADGHRPRPRRNVTDAAQRRRLLPRR